MWTEGGWVEENSILGRTVAGQTTRDALKLTRTLQPIAGRYRLRIRENGNDRTVLDALSLILASPNDSDQVVALGDSAMFGVLQPIQRAYLASGTDVTSLVTAGAGGERFVGEPGETLYVEPYSASAIGVPHLQTSGTTRPLLNPGGVIVGDDGDKDGGVGLRETSEARQ